MEEKANEYLENGPVLAMILLFEWNLGSIFLGEVGVYMPMPYICTRYYGSIKSNIVRPRWIQIVGLLKEILSKKVIVSAFWGISKLGMTYMEYDEINHRNR